MKLPRSPSFLLCRFPERVQTRGPTFITRSVQPNGRRRSDWPGKSVLPGVANSGGVFEGTEAAVVRLRERMRRAGGQLVGVL